MTAVTNILLGATVASSLAVAASATVGWLGYRRDRQRKTLQKTTKPARFRTAHPALSKEALAGLLISVILAVVTSASAPWWFHYLERNTNSATPNTDVTGFKGGCATFPLFAQGRWDPLGAAKRSAPTVLSPEEGFFAANQTVLVDGYVHGRPAYPTNSPPYNSDVWFHLADGSGWVSFASVRAIPTSFDATGQNNDPQDAAPTPAACEGETVPES